MTPYYSDPWLDVYQGDCRAVLAELPAESVHCVVTSPPYWGLRDYGDTAQLGLEPTPEEYVANLVDVFREVRRVLRSDGTVWLNLGDSYANDTKWGGASGGKHVAALHGQTGIGRQKVTTGLKAKDLVGIPWRVAFALQADGWYLRSEIIWAKPNPMPESVTDRPTKSHEMLFLLSKSPRYFFDADAVREANVVNPDWNYGSENYRRDITQDEQKTDGDFRRPRSSGDGWSGFAAAGPDGSGRNIRSVWTIATQPYPGAHFATFPRKLVEPCIKAGTSERGVCPECGTPWVRVVAVDKSWRTDAYDDGGVQSYGPGSGNRTVRPSNGGMSTSQTHTTGWARSCDHDAIPTPATVLDIFAGSGTTGLVAQSLSRRAILIDLNADYLVQALGRNRDIPLGLSA